MNRSSLYTDARREFVTSPAPITIRKLAPKYNRTPSSMYRIARLEGWEAERLAYQNRTQEIVSATASEELARRLIQLNDDVLSATEESIEVYRKKLADGSIVPTPADITKLVTSVREALGPRREESDGASGLHISESGLRSLAGLVEGVARERLATGAMGTAPEPKPVGSS